jgi:hypothetical protein
MRGGWPGSILGPAVWTAQASRWWRAADVGIDQVWMRLELLKSQIASHPIPRVTVRSPRRDVTEATVRATPSGLARRSSTVVVGRSLKTRFDHELHADQLGEGRGRNDLGSLGGVDEQYGGASRTGDCGDAIEGRGNGVGHDSSEESDGKVTPGGREVLTGRAG